MGRPGGVAGPIRRISSRAASIASWCGSQDQTVRNLYPGRVEGERMITSRPASSTLTTLSEVPMTCTSRWRRNAYTRTANWWAGKRMPSTMSSFPSPVRSR